MKTSSLYKLWTQAWSMVLSEMSAQEVSGLVSARAHNIRLTAYRATTIVSRIRILSGLFAVLAPFWIAVDALALGIQTAQGLAPFRLLSAAAFAGVVFSLRKIHTLRDAYRALLLFLMIAGSIFAYTATHTADLQLNNASAVSSIGYTYLPFLILASMAIFPLTLLEGIAFSAPVIAIQVTLPLLTRSSYDAASVAATCAIMLFVTAVAGLAGISQLALMIVLARESLHDPLTHCFSRPGGEEMIDLAYTSTERSSSPLALAYISIDRLPKINAEFGYETGNHALTRAADILHDQLRAGDALIRWSGTDFVLVMPNADADEANSVVGRLLSGGLGTCPDRSPVTASIGVSERIHDEAADWWQMIDTANKRSGLARERGGNCTVDPDEQPAAIET
jgi:diguanylate cyclase (GGDEF)-like protein